MELSVLTVAKVVMWKVVVGGLLVLHGLIHAIGLAVEESTLPVGAARPIFDVLWLVAAVALVGAGLGVLFERVWWRQMAVVGVASSVVPVIWWWADAWGGMIANGVVVAAVVAAPRLHGLAVR